MWLCLLLGPPLAVTTYFHDHYISSVLHRYQSSPSPLESERRPPSAAFLQPHWSRTILEKALTCWTECVCDILTVPVWPRIHSDVWKAFFFPVQQYTVCRCCVGSLIVILTSTIHRKKVPQYSHKCLCNKQMIYFFYSEFFHLKLVECDQQKDPMAAVSAVAHYAAVIMMWASSADDKAAAYRLLCQHAVTRGPS